MNKEITYDAFSQWYRANKELLLEKAGTWKDENDALVQLFLEEWPIERLKTLKLDEYVTGKGPQNKSFCYEIEHGKYAEMYLGIRGGNAGKFGIYWSKDKNAYCDKRNQMIPVEELDGMFSVLIDDLVAIIQAGVTGNFDKEAFATTNSFYNRSSMITKLLCAYSTDKHYSGINMNSDSRELWSKLEPKTNNGGVYKQNFKITERISEQHSELNGDLLSSILWEYRLDVLGTFKPNKVVEKNRKSTSEVTSVYALELLKSKNIIFRGAPGTGKTYLANQIAAEIVSNGKTNETCELSDMEKDRISFVQFHPSYDYTDFVEGLRPYISDTGSVSFKLKSGSFMNFVKKAVKDHDEALSNNSEIPKYVFIIDEINRGEISKIFGELFFSIDPGYRGHREGVFTQYANLHTNPKEKFYIPENVYIVGTMNDIDRSVDTFDFAMRRRFSFIEITANESATNMLNGDNTMELMKRTNDAIVDPNRGGLTTDYQIGASYYLEVDREEETIEALWSTKIRPLLKDYFRGEVKTETKLEKIEMAYFNQSND